MGLHQCQMWCLGGGNVFSEHFVSVCVLGQGERRTAQSPHPNPDQEQNLDPEACWGSLHFCHMFCGSCIFLADVAGPLDISKLALAPDVFR